MRKTSTIRLVERLRLLGYEIDDDWRFERLRPGHWQRSAGAWSWKITWRVGRRVPRHRPKAAWNQAQGMNDFWKPQRKPTKNIGGKRKLAKGFEMLVLKRKRNERVDIGGGIVVTVVQIGPRFVRLGFDAPKDVPVNRREVTEAIEREGAQGGNPAKAAE